ncbi:adenylosuccinate synthase [Theileria orientalis]|uniref:Adenylosuccinate synthetase n=1 Tax=Theileria orientalis TaxID=68886 RepID=A0A976M6F0_THEOR|nr:adenylosuccinate synthase [Theileria orientalis]
MNSLSYDSAKHKVILISGMQWGDEGKGKLVSHLSPDFDLFARYNGGHNSGHEVMIDNVAYKLHLLPCGSLSRRALNVLGNGVVIHLESLIREIETLKKAGISIENRLFISERAHLIFDFHIELDKGNEADLRKYASKIGTTKRGIGPSYSTKCARTGIMIGEMFNWPNFEVLVKNLCHRMNIGRLSDEEIEEVANRELKKQREYFKVLKHCIVDVSFMIRQYIKTGKRVFFEGANGVLLDLSLGTYPFVTSSNTTSSGVYNGLGLNPSLPILKIGVLKCYQTRVGDGPFPTELFDETFEKLSKEGNEYGVSTGRSRRCGWLDMVAAKYAQETNGFDLINLTKLDVLSHLNEIKVCVSYKDKTTGRLLEDGRFPSCIYKFDEFEPVYKTFPGWPGEDLSKCTKFEDLPENCREYIKYIETELSVPIQWIGVGTDVKNMIIRDL